MMDSESVRRRVRVMGRVQGVAFRAHLADRAHAAGVAGWVRNQPDGSVEAIVEGAPAAVEKVVAWCREGPTWARVDTCDVSEEPAGDLRGFRIR